jgi:hypothetical protein
MPHRVEDKNDHILVSLWGDATKWDVIEAVGKIRIINPRKARPDIWIVSEEVVIPMSEYVQIVEESLKEFPEDFDGARSAIVVANEFQMEMVKLYKKELSSVPYEVALFRDIQEAVAWASGK